MEHYEVIQFICDVFYQKGSVILPSTSISDYKTFSDWEIGCKKHLEMSEIHCVLKEFLRLKKVGFTQNLSNEDLSSEQKTTKILELIKKYKIERVIIRRTGQEIYLDQ